MRLFVVPRIVALEKEKAALSEEVSEATASSAGASVEEVSVVTAYRLIHHLDLAHTHSARVLSTAALQSSQTPSRAPHPTLVFFAPLQRVPFDPSTKEAAATVGRTRRLRANHSNFPHCGPWSM